MELAEAPYRVPHIHLPRGSWKRNILGRVRWFNFICIDSESQSGQLVRPITAACPQFDNRPGLTEVRYPFDGFRSGDRVRVDGLQNHLGKSEPRAALRIPSVH